MTDFIPPMKAKLADEVFLTSIDDDPTWVAGEKFDGFREQLHLLTTGNELLSSEGNSHIAGVPQFKTLVPTLHDTILDSEGMAPTRRLEDNSTCFKVVAHPEDAIAWQDEHGMAFLVIFDILRYKGLDTVDLPFYKRRVLLESAFKELTRYCLFNTQVRLERLVVKGKLQYFREIVARTKVEGHEGIVLKDLGAAYKPGRKGNAWLKVKRYETLVYRIAGFLSSGSTDKYAGQIGSIVYGDNIGSASGIDDDTRLDMTKYPEKYVGKLAWFECQEITDMGVMRSPRFKGLLTPEEVKRYESTV